jgi:hypothetical protein
MIPKKFTSSHLPSPTAKTVGELRTLLSELPDNLRVSIGFDSKVELAVYEVGTDAEHLLLDEAIDDDDEDDDDEESGN